MQQNNRTQTILTFYIPVILSYFLINSPIISYLIAWFGSLFIFYITWLSPAAYYRQDLPIYKQVMRPIFLTQFVFAGFMCSTSIFYFMDHIGYRYFTEINYGAIFKESEQTALIAECQRLCLLGHAALVTGFLLVINAKGLRIKNVVAFEGQDFLIWLAVIVFGIGSICQRIPGLNQIALILTTIGISCAALLFVKGVIHKNVTYLTIGAIIFFLNFVHASLSGYKEPIIINVIILGCVFLPYYRKLILYLTLPVCYVLLYFLPTYNNTVRQSWGGEISAEEAQDQAFNIINNNENEEMIKDTNWGFLTNRLSEINMFTQFVSYIPEHHDFYGWEIMENSLDALIPRILWPEKPNMEKVSMERVYQAGAAYRSSPVSAKTRPIVDAYVSWGIPGVFFTLLIYGLITQSLCNTAESLFGGYELGCVVIFNSIFQGLWRGNNFEFMINNIFWGYIIMLVLYWILKTMRILRPNF
jgi:hypothetical protein